MILGRLVGWSGTIDETVPCLISDLKKEKPNSGKYTRDKATEHLL